MHIIPSTTIRRNISRRHIARLESYLDGSGSVPASAADEAIDKAELALARLTSQIKSVSSQVAEARQTAEAIQRLVDELNAYEVVTLPDDSM
jgi:ElaB/YqjD/DUF883 family membrane-anchored ribosome-binding protein